MDLTELTKETPERQVLKIEPGAKYLMVANRFQIDPANVWSFQSYNPNFQVLYVEPQVGQSVADLVALYKIEPQDQKLADHGRRCCGRFHYVTDGNCECGNVQGGIHSVAP